MTRTRSFAGDPNADLRTDKQKNKVKKYASELKKYGIDKKEFKKSRGGPNVGAQQKRALAKAKRNAAFKTVAKTTAKAVATGGRSLATSAAKAAAKRIAKSRKKK